MKKGQPISKTQRKMNSINDLAKYVFTDYKFILMRWNNGMYSIHYPFDFKNKAGEAIYISMRGVLTGNFGEDGFARTTVSAAEAIELIRTAP